MTPDRRVDDPSAAPPQRSARPRVKRSRRCCASASPRRSPTARSSWSGCSPRTCRWSCSRSGTAVAAEAPVGRFDQARVHRLLPGRARRPAAHQHLGGVAADRWRSATATLSAQAAAARSIRFYAYAAEQPGGASRCGSLVVLADRCDRRCARRPGARWRATIRLLLALVPRRSSAPGCSSSSRWCCIGALAFYVDSALGVFELWLGAAFASSPATWSRSSCCPAGCAGSRRVLPFRFMLALPGRDADRPARRGAGRLRELAAQWLYVAVPACSRWRVWRRGLRRFAAFGG